jgi:hypothetical protein
VIKYANRSKHEDQYEILLAFDQWLQDRQE